MRARCSVAATSGPARRRPTSARWSTRSTRRSPPRRRASRAVSSTSRPSTHRPRRREAKGIPVLAYNADVPAGNPNKRLAYIGQDLYASGYAMGQRIVNLVGEGDVALFIATPGQLNIQPRIDGATAAIKKFGAGKIKTSAIATGSQLNDEIAKIDAYYLGHKDREGDVRGRRRLDAGGRSDGGEVRPAEEGRQGRRVRPHADDAEADQQRTSWTSRSTSSRTCRVGCRCSSCSSTGTRPGSWHRPTRTPASCSSRRRT